MSRKNEFSPSRARPQDSQNVRTALPENPRTARGERPGNQPPRSDDANALSADDINEQIRAFFAKDLV